MKVPAELLLFRLIQAYAALCGMSLGGLDAAKEVPIKELEAAIILAEKLAIVLSRVPFPEDIREHGRTMLKKLNPED